MPLSYLYLIDLSSASIYASVQSGYEWTKGHVACDAATFTDRMFPLQKRIMPKQKAKRKLLIATTRSSFRDAHLRYQYYMRMYALPNH